VTVDELITLVNIALDTADASAVYRVGGGFQATTGGNGNVRYFAIMSMPPFVRTIRSQTTATSAPFGGRGNECSELVTTPLATALRHSASELGTLVTTTPMGCAVSEAIAQTAALRKAGGAGGRALDRLTSTFKG
jgi:hypothetical protein